MSSLSVRVATDTHEAALEGAALFADHAKQAIAERGRFTVLCSGGETPLPMYERMAELDLPWDKIHFFWGDERFVEPDDPASNYGNFKKVFLSKAVVPAQNIHRIKAEKGSAKEVAREYEDELRAFFGSVQWPRFDFAIQGIGTDGHTASLFPASQEELDPPDWVIAPFVEKLGVFRISVTLGVLNAVRFVLFLVTGEEKAPMIHQILYQPSEHQALLPAQRVQPAKGEVLWLLDPLSAKLGA